MNYYWVFQNKSFKEELQGSFLWAPICENRKIQHWLNILELRVGDKIIHSKNKIIVAVSEVIEEAKECEQPKELISKNLWDKKGYIVKVKYTLFDKELPCDYFYDKIYKLQPAKNAPVNKLRKGNTGYLFNINKSIYDLVINNIKP